MRTEVVSIFLTFFIVKNNLLPDGAEDFTADFATARFGTRKDAVRGGDDGHAEASEDARDFLPAAEAAEARRGVAADSADDGAARGVVFQLDAEDAFLAAFFGGRGFKIGDVSLVFQDFRYRAFHARGGHLDDFEAGGLGVADACEHIRDGV